MVSVSTTSIVTKHKVSNVKGVDLQNTEGSKAQMISEKLRFSASSLQMKASVISKIKFRPTEVPKSNLASSSVWA